jgi:hypothetical protein
MNLFQTELRSKLVAQFFSNEIKTRAVILRALKKVPIESRINGFRYWKPPTSRVVLALKIENIGIL